MQSPDSQIEVRNGQIYVRGPLSVRVADMSYDDPIAFQSSFVTDLISTKPPTTGQLCMARSCDPGAAT